MTKKKDKKQNTVGIFSCHVHAAFVKQTIRVKNLLILICLGLKVANIRK